MALNLIDLAKDYLTTDVLLKMSFLADESPAATQKAVGAIVPSLAGIACNQASGPGGASRSLGLLNSSGLDSNVLDNFSGALNGGSATEGLLKIGSNLLNALLGDKVGAVANVIASFSGIKVSSATKLLGLAAPLLFGLLGKHVDAGGVSAASLPTLLASHRDTIQQFAPAGLAGVLGLSRNSNLCGAADCFPGRRPKVFVVDDERVIARTLAIILRQAGYDAYPFYGAKTALEAGQYVAPDLLLTDVAMPDLDGIELACRMTDRWPVCKVLFFTGHATPASFLNDGRAAGRSFEVLRKPLHPNDLLAKVEFRFKRRPGDVVNLRRVNAGAVSALPPTASGL